MITELTIINIESTNNFAKKKVLKEKGSKWVVAKAAKSSPGYCDCIR